MVAAASESQEASGGSKTTKEATKTTIDSDTTSKKKPKKFPAASDSNIQRSNSLGALDAVKKKKKEKKAKKEQKEKKAKKSSERKEKEGGNTDLNNSIRMESLETKAEGADNSDGMNQSAPVLMVSAQDAEGTVARKLSKKATSSGKKKSRKASAKSVDDRMEDFLKKGKSSKEQASSSTASEEGYLSASGSLDKLDSPDDDDVDQKNNKKSKRRSSLRKKSSAVSTASNSDPLLTELSSKKKKAGKKRLSQSEHGLNASFPQSPSRRNSQKATLTTPQALPRELLAAFSGNSQTPRRGRREDILRAASLGEGFESTPLTSPNPSLAESSGTHSSGAARRRLSTRLIGRVSMFEAGINNTSDHRPPRNSSAPGKLEEAAANFLFSPGNNSLYSFMDDDENEETSSGAFVSVTKEIFEGKSDVVPDDVVLLTADDIRALVKNSAVSQYVVAWENVPSVGDSSSSSKKRKKRQRKTKKSRSVDKKKKKKKKKETKNPKVPETPDPLETYKLEEKVESDEEEEDPNTFDVFQTVRCPHFDFTDFVPPVFNNPDGKPKTEEQSELVRNAVEELLIFKEFRSGGKARNTMTMETLVNAFEPITIDDVMLQQGRKDLKKVKQESMRNMLSTEKEELENVTANSEDEPPCIYIVEKGQVDFQMNGVTIGSAKAGETFGEEALLNYQHLTIIPSEAVDKAGSKRSSKNSVAQVKDDDDNTETDCDSDLDLALEPTSLLRLDSRTYQGILQTQVKESDELKRDIIEGIDFLKLLLHSGNEEESDNLLGTLASLLERRELIEGEVLENIPPDEIFYIIHTGTMDVAKQTDQDQIITSLNRKGDYYGERAILGSIPRRISDNERDSRVCLKVTSEEAVVFSMKGTALESAFGRARLEKLHHLLIFGKTDIFQKVTDASSTAASQLTATTMEHLAQKIEQKTFLPGEGQDLLKDEKPDQPAIYVVQEGSALVKYTSEEGEKVEKTVQAGEVFGDTQIQQDNTSNTDKPKFRRREGFKAITSGEEPVSVGILPLQEIQNAQEEAAVQSDNNDYDDLEYTNDLGSFQLRNKVRTAIQADIRFEDLEKVSVLGEGQFGEVWLVAVDVFKTGVDALKQRFALKTQHKNDEIRGDQADDAIRLEIEAMNALNHPNIVNLVNTYEDETSIYLLMGLIPGGELWNYVHKEDDDGNFNSGIPESEAKFYTMVLADTLAFIHHRNYVFRDLKPENIMLDEDGYPVIVDFGFAKHIPDEDNGKTYTFCGTPNYAAPEIITNSGHGKPVDYWALGITIYEMITGENPFFYDGMEQMALYDAICEEDYYKYSDDKSSALTDLTNRLLEKHPALRLGTLAGGVTDIMQHEWFEELELSRLRSRIQKAPWKPQVDEEEDLDDEAVEEIMAGLNNNHVELVRESEPKSSEGALKISLPFDDSMKFEEIEEHESSGSLQFGNDSDYLEETVPLSQESEKSFFESHQLENSLMFEIQEGENEDAVSTDNESLHIEDDEDQDSLVETVLLSKESNISPNVENHRDENSLRIENIVEGENEDVLSADESLGVEDDNDFAKESTKLSEEGTTAEMMQNQSDSYSGGTDQSEISGKDERSSFQSVADDDYSGKPAMFFSNKTKSRFDSNSVTATPKKRQSYLNGQVLRHHHSAGAGRRKKLFGKIDIQKKERRSTILGSLEGLGLDDSEIGNDSFWGLDGEK